MPAVNVARRFGGRNCSSFNCLAICVDVHQKGFRKRRLLLVTTLLDSGKYSVADLAAAYRARWNAEIYHSYCLHCNSLYHLVGQGLGVVSSAA